MVVFRVTENINIKTTDGTLVKYTKLQNPASMLNETLYVTTYEDFEDLKRVFSNVGAKYKARVIDENKIRGLSQFPRELGISNINEYNITQSLDFKYKSFLHDEANKEAFKSLYLNENQVDLRTQINGILKQDITLAVLGNLGMSISEMICSCSALRLLYEALRKKFKSVTIDIYLNASDNTYYSRDKMIYTNQAFIHKVSALSLDVKALCSYDFFIDASSVRQRSYYKSLPHIDAWLYKCGIDPFAVQKEEKYNQINISAFKPNKELKNKIEHLKIRGKVLLFHPFSANINKSIPKDVAVSLLKNLLTRLPEYTVVSVLKIDSKLDSDRYMDVSAFSKSFLDYAYIVSNMTKIVTVNTATYHMADAFFIPTVVIFTDENDSAQLYPTSKAIYVKDKSKNFSHFVFENDALLLHKFDGWKELKVSKIIKLLETF